MSSETMKVRVFPHMYECGITGASTPHLSTHARPLNRRLHNTRQCCRTCRCPPQWNLVGPWVVVPGRFEHETSLTHVTQNFTNFHIIPTLKN